jgi:hypothetical protein
VPLVATGKVRREWLIVAEHAAVEREPQRTLALAAVAREPLECLLNVVLCVGGLRG